MKWGVGGGADEVYMDHRQWILNDPLSNTMLFEGCTQEYNEQRKRVAIKMYVITAPPAEMDTEDFTFNVYKSFK